MAGRAVEWQSEVADGGGREDNAEGGGEAVQDVDQGIQDQVLQSTVAGRAALGPDASEQ